MRPWISTITRAPTVGRQIDPGVPVHRQQTFAVRQHGHDTWHEWFHYENGVECPHCDTLPVRIDGRRRYRGRHRR
jgi:hypothetical protein